MTESTSGYAQYIHNRGYQYYQPPCMLCNDWKAQINPFTPELKKCILPTFQKAIVWVM